MSTTDSIDSTDSIRTDSTPESRLESLKGARLLIAGRVQGVGYRAATLKMAEYLQITGWVRNLPDGRVEAVMEGREGAIAQMVQWCHQGPPAAQVQSVSVEETVPQGFAQFRVTR